jgi:hypothetical protein
MNNKIDDALSAQRESANIEFKESFDVTSAQEWCEVIKDIVAISNTGSGTIVFGLQDNGTPSGRDVTLVLSLDSAEIIDKIHKYTNTQFADFRIQRCEKAGNILAAMIIEEVQLPLVFEKPGTYDIGGGKQRTAFGMGTVYFRHGPKSEPGNSDDLRSAFERQLVKIRELWLKNVRQVVEAPIGSTIVTISPTSDPAALSVKLSNDPNAPIIGGLSPDRTHPYRQKELVEVINHHFSSDKHINQYDIQCVRKLYDIENNLAFHYLPKFGGHQYSPVFSEWIMNQYQADSMFFLKARKEMQERRKASKKSVD